MARHGVSPRVVGSVVSTALQSAPRAARPPLFFPCGIRRSDATVFVEVATSVWIAAELCASLLGRPRRAAERANASTCRLFSSQTGELLLSPWLTSLVLGKRSLDSALLNQIEYPPYDQIYRHDYSLQPLPCIVVTVYMPLSFASEGGRGDPHPGAMPRTKWTAVGYSICTLNEKGLPLMSTRQW